MWKLTPKLRALQGFGILDSFAGLDKRAGLKQDSIQMFEQGGRMPEENTSSWQLYRVGPKGSLDKHTTECQSFVNIYHVTHVRYALEILRDSKIVARPVYDDSVLNVTRTHVVWLSPNDWHGGSRYGGVSFQFDWKSLVQGKNWYWIGAVGAYSPAAVRLLVTKKTHQYKRYDPTAGDGPWWRDSKGDDYWNGRFCLEVMVEEDLEIGQSVLGATGHHSYQCCIDPGGVCSDAGEDEIGALGRFVVGAIAHGLSDQTSLFKRYPNMLLLKNSAFNTFSPTTSKVEYSGPVSARHPAAGALVRAVFGAAYRRDREELTAIASLFSSSQDFTDSCERMLVTYFR